MDRIPVVTLSTKLVQIWSTRDGVSLLFLSSTYFSNLNYTSIIIRCVNTPDKFKEKQMFKFSAGLNVEYIIQSTKGPRRPPKKERCCQAAGCSRAWG